MSNVSVKLTWDNTKIQSVNQKAMQGLIKMGYDIAAQARRNAPYVTGALRNSIRVRDIDNNSIEVVAGGVFGNKDVPYAWIREQGPNRDRATEHYMENAQKFIMSGNYLEKYLGDIT